MAGIVVNFSVLKFSQFEGNPRKPLKFYPAKIFHCIVFSDYKCKSRSVEAFTARSTVVLYWDSSGYMEVMLCCRELPEY